MIIGSHIWTELGELSQYVEKIDHETGDVTFKSDSDASGREAVALVVQAHVVVSVAELKSGKRAELSKKCEADIAALRAGYPESEVLSWSKQEDEARALVADANAATPLLDALSEARGIDKAVLAGRVIAKADAFAGISGTLIGKRQRLEDQLDALPADATPEQVAAIDW